LSQQLPWRSFRAENNNSPRWARANFAAQILRLTLRKGSQASRRRHPPPHELRRGKQRARSCIVSRLRSVNFPAMPDGEQMNPVLLHVEGVNDPIVANASSKTVRSSQPMMWKRFQAQSDFIDFPFNACSESYWQLEENGIETRVVNLGRRAHEPSGLRTRATFPAAMSRSDR
jgi:hypothetical protein